MSFTLAVIIVLAIAVIVLGFACFGLFDRLNTLETAVSGGMTAPSRTLTREEYGQRFMAARARAAFANELDTAVVLFLDEASQASKEILATLHHLTNRRGFVLAFREGAPPLPVEQAVVDQLGSRIDDLAIPVLPYAMVIDDGRVTAYRPISNLDTLEQLLFEAA